MTAALQKDKPHRKIKIAVIVFGLLVVATCTMIYLFSSQDATQSTLTSGWFTDLIKKIIFPGFEDLPPEEKAELSGKLSLFVRKGAHFSEYLLLATFSFHFLVALPRPRTDLMCAFCALLFAAAFAMTDEYHQSFVPGRAMAAKDMLIDTLGALLGVFIALRIHSFRKKRRERSTEESEG